MTEEGTAPAEGQAPVLEVALAAPHHLLAVADDVVTQDVEALAVSRSERAGWRGSQHLQLCAGASLTGPWALQEEARRVFDLPAWATHAYLLRCPVQRAGRLPDELRGSHEILDAFAAGVPTGVEAEALDHLYALARRLRGALRLAGSGAVVTPDPEAMVDLTVLSPVWLDPAACEQVLGEALPHLRSLLDAPEAVGPAPDRLAVGHSGPRAAAVARIDPDERAWLHAEADAFDAAALRTEQVLTGYGLVAELPGVRGVVEVSVVGVEQVPTVLRDAAWAREGAVGYELRWHPLDPELAYSSRPPLAVRRERAAARAAVERAARSLLAVVGGEICDDDGFLVDPEALPD